MKMKSLILAALAVAVLYVAPVSAMSISTSANLGVLPASGTVLDTTATTDGLIDAQYKGSLPSMSKITFTYTIDGAENLGAIYARLRSIGSTFDTSLYNVFAEAHVGPSVATSTSGDSLVIATAALPTIKSGVTTLTNKTAGNIDIESSIFAYLTGGASLRVIATVTQIPLPAALPLFGLGIAALAGYRARKCQA